MADIIIVSAGFSDTLAEFIPVSDAGKIAVAKAAGMSVDGFMSGAIRSVNFGKGAAEYISYGMEDSGLTIEWRVAARSN